MSVLAVDEVWLREPRLLVPGMQPVGLVKIDWSNPITKDLYSFYLSTPYGVFDVAKNKLIPFPVYKKYTGKNLLITPTQTAELIVESYGNTSGWGHNSTVLQVIQQGAVDYLAPAYFFASSTNWHGYRYYYGAGGGGQVIAFGSASAYYVPSSYNGKTFAICTAVSYVGYQTSPAWAYLDGTEVYSVTNASATATTCDFRMNDRSAMDLGAATFGFWKRTLSKSECASISADPYQFLIPA